MLIATRQDRRQDTRQGTRQNTLDQSWREAVLTTIRCAAFVLARRSRSADEATLDSYCSKFDIEVNVAQVLINGPLNEFWKELDASSDNTENAESLCKLYELTLNLVPVETGSQAMKVQIADKARKRRGSFYTPIALSRLTVEAALESLHYKDLSEVLNLRILDPAMGAGVFLLSAHRYLFEAATNLLSNQTVHAKGAIETSHIEEAQDAKGIESFKGSARSKGISKLIAQNCIYGVDIDDVAVEAAKLALWLAVGDYDLHPSNAFPNLRVGNSLVGAREESVSEFPKAVWKRKDLVESRLELSAPANLAGQCERLDRWCAYWFMSTEDLQNNQLSGEVVLEYKKRLKFFHWNSEFPEVFASESPGFDAVIGNPPWEIEKPNSREFFGSFTKEYWNLGKQDAIKTQEELKERFPHLEQEWLRIYRDHYSMANWVKHAPLQFGYSHPSNSESDQTSSFQYQGRGDANLYKLFVEQSYYLAKNGGTIGLIVPSGIYSDCGTRELRQLLLDQCDLKRIIGFDNSDGAFDIHRSFKYCVFVATRGGATEKTSASFMNTAAMFASAEAGVSTEFKSANGEGKFANAEYSKNVNAELRNADAELNSYDRASIERISPKWSVICEVENKRNLELLDKIYSSGIRLGDCEFNGVKLQYAREFDMTLDSKLFHARERIEESGGVQDIFGNWIVGNWRDELARSRGGSERSRDGSARTRDGSGSDVNEIIHSAKGDKFLSIEEISKVFVPLYEGRMIGQFDYNEKQWVSGKGRQAVWSPTGSKKILGPQYLVESDIYKERRAASFKTGFLAVGSPTNARTMISTCLSEVACGNSVPVFFLPESSVDFREIALLNPVEFHLMLTSIFNSFVFDYALRRRMSGNNLNYFVLEECSIPNLAALNAVHAVAAKAIVKLAIRLALDASRFGAQLGAVDCISVPSVLDQAERARLRAGIDALVAYLYGLTGEEFQLILAGEANQKGFWRVDKDLPAHQSLTQNALQMYERLLEVGCDDFCKELESKELELSRAELELSLQESNGKKNRRASAQQFSELLSTVLRS